MNEATRSSREAHKESQQSELDSALSYEQIRRLWLQLKPGETLHGAYRIWGDAAEEVRRNAFGQLGISNTDPEFTLFRDDSGAYLAELEDGEALVTITHDNLMRTLSSMRATLQRGQQKKSEPAGGIPPLRAAEATQKSFRAQRGKLVIHPPGLVGHGELTAENLRKLGTRVVRLKEKRVTQEKEKPPTNLRPPVKPRKLLSLRDMMSSSTVRSHLMNFATHLTKGNIADAEDIVQSTYEKLMPVSERFIPEKNLKTRAYLVRTLRNTFYTKYGREKKSPSREEILAHVHVQPKLSTLSPQEAALILEDVERILASMSPERRECIMLAAVDGLSYEEIADLMETPVGTVKSRVHRAREELQRMLENAPSDDIERWLVGALRDLEIK